MVIRKFISQRRRELGWTLSRWFNNVKTFLFPDRPNNKEIPDDNSAPISDETARVLEQLKFQVKIYKNIERV